MLKSVLIGAVGLILPALTIAQTINEPIGVAEAPEVEISHRVPLSRKPVPGFDKYSGLVDRTANFKPDKTYLQIFGERLWGKDHRALRFENALSDYEAWKQRQTGPRGTRKRLGVAEAQAQLHQAEGGAMFHGPMYFGTSQEQFDVIYDTGSDWLVVEGKNCTNCKGNTYDPASSAQSKQVGKTVSARQYGSAVLLGTEFTDKVCVNSFQACVDNFQYFQITVNQTGLAEPFDGILGMARNRPFLLSDDQSTANIGPLLVDALAE